jgi:hypothetical protein
MSRVFFLHYALDLWAHAWRKRVARGRVIIVRYADDFVMGFERESDARNMAAALKERLAKFRPLLFLSSGATLTTASISLRKLSNGTINLSASSGSPLALIASRRLSRS